MLSVSVPKDGFYAIESDGLLDLIARLDAPRLPMVWHKSSDDSARNFTLQGPLSKGEYRLLVRARGKSQGRAVIRLSERSSQRSAAMLVGQPLRRWMNSGSPAESKFIVQEAGRYRLRVYALGGHYPFELTDSDGWPLIKPGTLADVELSLKAGAHRLRIWPTYSRRRAVAEADSRSVNLQDHGAWAPRHSDQCYAKAIDGSRRGPRTLPSEMFGGFP